MCHRESSEIHLWLRLSCFTRSYPLHEMRRSRAEFINWKRKIGKTRSSEWFVISLAMLVHGTIFSSLLEVIDILLRVTVNYCFFLHYIMYFKIHWRVSERPRMDERIFNPDLLDCKVVLGTKRVDISKWYDFKVWINCKMVLKVVGSVRIVR